MSKPQNQFSHRPSGPPAASGVERACDITRSLFNAARGSYQNDAETIQSIAERARLTPAVVRRFLQPSRRPKDVSLGVWQRLVFAYRRLLNQQLQALETEIHRLEALDPHDGAIRALLDDAKALVRKIESAALEVPPEGSSGPQ